MRTSVALFAITVLATAAIDMRWVWLEWAVFLPMWAVVLWRWRCWKFGERLLKSGGGHLETGKLGRLVRHKTCGADLS